MNYYIKVLKQYADFNGRARRSEYWYFVLFNVIIFYALSFLSFKIGFPMLAVIYNIAVLLPAIAVAIRRMHDVGKSGWYCLIPIYNLILAFMDSDKGTNQYGPDPKGASSLADGRVLDSGR